MNESNVIQRLHLTLENLVDSDPVIIPYTVIKFIYRLYLIPYMVQSQGHHPPSFRERGVMLGSGNV